MINKNYNGNTSENETSLQNNNLATSQPAQKVVVS